MMRRWRVLVDRLGGPEVLRVDIDDVLDPLGGASLRRSWTALRPGGRLVSYGFLAAQPGDRASALVDLLRLRAWVLLPNGRRAAFYRVSVAAPRHPARVRAALTKLVSELDSDRLRPLVAARVPLDQPARAHQLAEGHARGKVLLIP
jgi:NADPH2:quinone reductase